jgi:hypothetical protein
MGEMEHPAWHTQDVDGIWWGKGGIPPVDGSGNRKMLIASHYKYFISVENTIMDDYVTEKFYEGLLTDSVMVYLGAPNARSYAPSPQAFISALDFDGPAALATFLIELAADEERYSTFSAWQREVPIRVAPTFVQAMNNDPFRLDDQSMLCDLCTLVHNGDHTDDAGVGEFCSIDKLTPGKWVTKSSSHNKWMGIPCCSWDEGDYQQPSVCDNAFLPNHEEGYRGVQGGWAFSGGHSCFCKSFQPRDTRIYEPSDCTLRDWNASLFCDLLAGRTILLIGDSTMSQTATVLMNSVSSAFMDSSTTGCEHSIIFAPGDTLIGKPFGVMNRGKTWVEHVRLIKPDIVVVNAGAHITSTDGFMEVLNQVISDHSNNLEISHVPIIWRSQFPAGCEDSSTPATTLDLDSEAYWEDYAKRRPIYNYPLLKEWDHAASNAFVGGKRHYMDLWGLRGRPDGHVGSSDANGPYKDDCIHYCTPGPLDDLVPRAFFQLLAGL